MLRTLASILLALAALLGLPRMASAEDIQCASGFVIGGFGGGGSFLFDLALTDDRPVCRYFIDPFSPVRAGIRLAVAGPLFPTSLSASVFDFDTGENALVALPITVTSGPCALNTFGAMSFVPSTVCEITASGIFPGTGRYGGLAAGVRARITQSAAGSFGNISITVDSLVFSIGAAAAKVARAGAVKSFMASRADQILANDVDLRSRLDAPDQQAGAPPVNFSASQSETHERLRFATSLRQMLGVGQRQSRNSDEAASDEAATVPGGTPVRDPGLARGMRDHSRARAAFDIWASGTHASISNGGNRGDLSLLALGADVRFSEPALAGVLVQFDRFEESSRLTRAAIEGQGWMTGPYGVARIGGGLMLDGKALFGRSSNELAEGDVPAGAFSTSRWLLQGRLSSDLELDRWKIRPHVSLLYFEERQQAFSDAAGSLTPEQRISIGRVAFGPEVSTTLTRGDGTTLSPFATITGIWDFDRGAATVQLGNGLVVETSADPRARVEGGSVLRLANGWQARASGFYDGIGSRTLEAYGGGLTLSLRLD